MSAPSITTPTLAALLATSATLGGNVTSAGTASLTEVGVLLALTAANNNPTLGGSGVIKVILATPATGVFTVPVTGLFPNGNYSFVAYATSSVGTTYTSVSTFTTLRALQFNSAVATGTFATTGQTLWIRYRSGEVDQLDGVIRQDYFEQVWKDGTYRDTFGHLIVQAGGTFGNGVIGLVQNAFTAWPAVGTAASTTTSDDFAHIPPRQLVEQKGGILFTLVSGLQVPVFFKDYRGMSTTAPGGGAPSNVFN